MSRARPELEHGITLFLDQLIKTLSLEQTSEPLRSRKVSGPSGGGKPVLSEIGETAARHGKELLQHGFTVEQVVHDYGDLCQAVTDLGIRTRRAYRHRRVSNPQSLPRQRNRSCSHGVQLSARFCGRREAGEPTE